MIRDHVTAFVKSSLTVRDPSPDEQIKNSSNIGNDDDLQKSVSFSQKENPECFADQNVF